jgi:hypothetical protein
MGLDQYAYIASQADTDWKDSSRQELAYWRKHPNLQGWMEQLWNEKVNMAHTAPMDGSDAVFNGIELELSWEDVDRLERDIRSGSVAQLGTTGFFFGNHSDDVYHKQDLQFCRDAKAELFVGRRVFYTSSW